MNASAVVRQPVAACLLLLIAYGLLSLLTDPGGYLGTDTGAKVATLEHMTDNDTSRPSVGYWAAEWDPDGEYHPLFDTRRNARGEWVNVTTLPMLLAAQPLYDLGGYRLALLLPMLGGVATALASRNIARQLAGDEVGVQAFWIVGLASPIAVYALDFWEHAPGAALMLWATALMLRFVRDRTPAWAPLLAGVLLGASATMRTETFGFAFVLVAASCLVVLLRRDIVRAAWSGVLTVVGFAGPWLANAALESDLGGNSRTDRVTDEAQREVWTETGERFEEAVVTWFGLPGFTFPVGEVLGAVVVLTVLAAGALHRRGEHRPVAYALAGAGLVYLVAMAGGFGFVPGALVASPVAIAAVWARRDVPGWYLVPAALAATFVIWLFQLIGGAGPQWGGRYLLAPTLVFTTFGVVALQDRPDVIRRTLVGFAVGVTAFGIGWLAIRSHQVDTFFDELAERPEDVVISTNGFLVREGGAAYEERRYLSLGRGAGLRGAVEVVDDAGLSSFGVLTQSAELPPVDATPAGVERTEFLGVTFWYHRFELDR